jgi:transcriptional regulator with XRE-family HTH domain
MRTVLEREHFGERLREALERANYSPASPTAVAREFNIRFPGRPVSAHAVRKWLNGEAIPTAEKLNTLSRWLGVPAGWLRFALEKPASRAAPEKAMSGLIPRLNPEDVKLISSLKELDAHHRLLLTEIIGILARLKPASGLTEKDKLALLFTEEAVAALASCAERPPF